MATPEPITTLLLSLTLPPLPFPGLDQLVVKILWENCQYRKFFQLEQFLSHTSFSNPVEVSQVLADELDGKAAKGTQEPDAKEEVLLLRYGHRSLVVMNAMF